MIFHRPWRPRCWQSEDHWTRGSKPNDGAQLWLEGFLGFEPKMVMFHVNLWLIAVKFNPLTQDECGLFPLFACYILAFATQMRMKARKKPQPGSRKVPVGHDSMCQQHSLLQVASSSYRSLSPSFTEPGSTLGQRTYPPSCVTKGFHKSVNIQSNLSEIWRGQQREGLPNHHEFAC